MNPQQLLHLITCEPWYITQPALESLRDMLSSALKTSPQELVAKGKTLFGDDIEEMKIAGGLAVIPIKGPMGLNVGSWGRALGMTDMADIARDIEEARQSSEVLSVLLDCNTPGGTATGTPELSAKIGRLAGVKDVFAFTEGQLCSAGLYAACKAGATFATPSSIVGSIGACASFTDASAHLAAQGIKVEVISSGKYKGAGQFGTSLTPDQRQHMQDRINALADDFKSAIMEARPNLDSEYMQGQTFTGKEAEKIGLVDILVGSKQEAIEALGFDSREFTKRQK